MKEINNPTSFNQDHKSSRLFLPFSAILCPPEPSFPNARRLTSGRTVAATITYLCDDDYQFDSGRDTEVIQCVSDGQTGAWSATNLMCQSEWKIRHTFVCLFIHLFI